MISIIKKYCHSVSIAVIVWKLTREWLSVAFRNSYVTRAELGLRLRVG